MAGAKGFAFILHPMGLPMYGSEVFSRKVPFFRENYWLAYLRLTDFPICPEAYSSLIWFSRHVLYVTWISIKHMYLILPPWGQNFVLGTKKIISFKSGLWPHKGSQYMNWSTVYLSFLKFHGNRDKIEGKKGKKAPWLEVRRKIKRVWNTFT